ncbi:MAG: NYN domain-containing protein [Planctomycetota bacterium]|jgi:uncharacterized LabA/DUF88 family protein
MTTYDKRLMMFVDGENFTIRIQRYVQELGQQLKGKHYQDVYYWDGWVEMVMFEQAGYALMKGDVVRRYYYTSATGDPMTINRIRDELLEQRFSPVVIHKKKGTKAKGVDIALTKDMLVHAFLDNYDVAVLVAGDGDYVPLLEEIKRLGKRIVVVFFDEKHGLNPELRRCVDRCVILSIDFT